MYRQTKNYENLQKRIFYGVGEYGIPQIQPTQYKECEWIGFNYARSEKNRAGISCGKKKIGVLLSK